MRAGAWPGRLLVAGAAVAASTAHNMVAESTTTMRGALKATAGEAAGAGMSPLSLPTLMAGVEGLSPPCQKGAFCVV